MQIKRIFQKSMFFLLLFAVTGVCWALPFTIVPKVSLPTTISTGSIVSAYYTVANNTGSQRNNNYVKWLPTNVTQVTSGGTFGDTCGTTFNLAARGQPGNSCTLQLTVSGPVSSSTTNQHLHLFVCFPDGIACAGTNSPLNVTSSGASPPPIPTKQEILYSTNDQDGSIRSCPLSPNGVIGPCTIEGQGGNLNTFMLGIAINPAHTFVYANSDLSQNVIYCDLNADGSVTNCLLTGGTPYTNNSTGIVINSAGTFAYTTSTGVNQVSSCSLNPDGSFGACTAATGFNGPAGLTLNPAGTLLYVANGNTNQIFYCAINGNGSIGTCIATGAGLSQPLAIAINPANTIAYITSSNTNSVNACSINPNGNLGACIQQSQTFNFPYAIAINSAGTFAFVASVVANFVYSCPILPNGNFGTCFASTSQFGQPVGLTIISK